MEFTSLKINEVSKNFNFIELLSSEKFGFGD